MENSKNFKYQMLSTQVIINYNKPFGVVKIKTMKILIGLMLSIMFASIAYGATEEFCIIANDQSDFELVVETDCSDVVEGQNLTDYLKESSLTVELDVTETEIVSVDDVGVAGDWTVYQSLEGEKWTATTDMGIIPVEDNIFVLVRGDKYGGKPFMLRIGDEAEIDFDINGDDEKADITGDSLSDPKPGTVIKVNIEVENLFKSGEDVLENREIKDVKFTLEISDIDYDEEFDLSDLEPGDDDELDIEIEIPYMIDSEDDVTLDIKLEAEDKESKEKLDFDFGTDFDFAWDKETHELIFTKLSLGPTEVECSGDAEVSVTALNIGEEEEDDVVVTIKNTALEINEKFELGTLDQGDDSDAEWSKRVALFVSEGTDAGNYRLDVKVESAKTSASDTVSLSVEECVVDAPVDDEGTGDEGTGDEGTGDEGTDLTGDGIDLTGATTADGGDDGEGTASIGGLLEGPGLIALIVGVDILLLLVGAIIIVSFVKKK